MNHIKFHNFIEAIVCELKNTYCHYELYYDDSDESRFGYTFYVYKDSCCSTKMKKFILNNHGDAGIYLIEPTNPHPTPLIDMSPVIVAKLMQR